MGLSKKIFLTVALLCSPLTFADSDSLVKDNHKVYFKQGSLKIFLFDDANYCFDKDAFSLESLTNDKRKYLFVNYTDDCNPSGKYQIFDISNNKAHKFYLSPLYDPEVINDKKQIIERFKDGSISYTRIYKLKNDRYSLQEELKTLSDNLNLSVIYYNKSTTYSLKDNSNQTVKNIRINIPKVFIRDKNHIKTKAYIVKNDKVTIKNIIKKNDSLYLHVEYYGKTKTTEGYIKLSDIF